MFSDVLLPQYDYDLFQVENWNSWLMTDILKIVFETLTLYRFSSCDTVKATGIF